MGSQHLTGGREAKNVLLQNQKGGAGGIKDGLAPATARHPGDRTTAKDRTVFAALVRERS